MNAMRGVVALAAPMFRASPGVLALLTINSKWLRDAGASTIHWRMSMFDESFEEESTNTIFAGLND
jgi:hypothetical protein